MFEKSTLFQRFKVSAGSLQPLSNIVNGCGKNTEGSLKGKPACLKYLMGHVSVSACASRFGPLCKIHLCGHNKLH